MIETELKIALDEPAMAQLKRSSALAELRLAPRRTERLVSVYYDTADHALAAAGVALRLRRVGRSWVQTVKRRGESDGASGLFANREDERRAPGGRLVLQAADDDGALADVAAAAAGAPLAAVFETHVERVVERLRGPDGGEVELALDTGEIRAGEARAPIREAELELKAGEVAGLYAVARRLFPGGPVHFSTANKSARGYRLARGAASAEALEPRRAGTIEVDGATPVELVARDVLRDCMAQIAANMTVVAHDDAVEGPHQLRIGLRRLRTAFRLFGPSLGAESMAALSEAAKRLGRVVGRLRDADVLLEDVVAKATEGGLDAEARERLTAALQARREEVRAEVRRELAGGEATGFLFELGAFIEGRGWLSPSDYAQTGQLAQPVAEVAPAILEERLKKVLKRGRRIRKLDAEGLHALRKELKTLRYAVDMLGPIYKGAKVAGFLRSLKDLQDCFGSLNDAAMAQDTLTGAEAPAPGDPAAQRGVGWTLGTLAVRAERDRSGLFARWDELAAARPFWR
jgi:triphosphatase